MTQNRQAIATGSDQRRGVGRLSRHEQVEQNEWICVELIGLEPYRRRLQDQPRCQRGDETILRELSRLEVHKLDRIMAHLGIAQDPPEATLTPARGLQLWALA
jgi:hypothetical protein